MQLTINRILFYKQNLLAIVFVVGLKNNGEIIFFFSIFLTELHEMSKFELSYLMLVSGFSTTAIIIVNREFFYYNVSIHIKIENTLPSGSLFSKYRWRRTLLVRNTCQLTKYIHKTITQKWNKYYYFVTKASLIFLY